MKLYFPIKKGAIKKFFKEEIEYPAGSKIGMAIVNLIGSFTCIGVVFILIGHYNPKAPIFMPIGIALLAIGAFGYFTFLILDKLYKD